jgi:ParB-like chromosome segregation protein Spo0J
MPKPNWHTETRLIADLIPAKYNPRELTEKQASDLSQSLDKFGLPEPIVINLNNVIIGGHQRIKLLQVQGGGERGGRAHS